MASRPTRRRRRRACSTSRRPPRTRPRPPSDVPAAAASPAADAAAKPGAAARPAKPAVELGHGPRRHAAVAPASATRRAAGARAARRPSTRRRRRRSGLDAGIAGTRGAARAAAPAPPGLPERRQPPAPDAVQMTAFSPDGAAAAAKPKPRDGPGRQRHRPAAGDRAASSTACDQPRARARPAGAARARAVAQAGGGLPLVLGPRHRDRSRGAHAGVRQRRDAGRAAAAGNGVRGGRHPGPAARARSRSRRCSRRQRARLAFYQQMRDSMRAANNQPELRQAEIRLADKQRLVDETNASLAKLVVRASEPGEVVETLAKVGMPVSANAPLVRVKGRMLHGEFELDAEEIAAAGKLGFCRVEVVGLGPRASNAEPAAPPATGGRHRLARRAGGAALRRLHASRSRAPSARSCASRCPTTWGWCPGSRCASRASATTPCFPSPPAAGQRRRRPPVGLDRRPRPAPPSGATSPSPTWPTTRWSATACASATR